jgi:hypothetical protein
VTDRAIASARSEPGAERLAYAEAGGGYHPAAVFLLPPLRHAS